MLLAVALQAATSPLTIKVPATQQALDAISDSCHVPRSWLVMSRDNGVLLRASPNADYRKIECVIGRLQKTVAPMKLGFIGNAQVSDNK